MQDLSILGTVDVLTLIAELKARAQPPVLHSDEPDPRRRVDGALAPFSGRTLAAALLTRLGEQAWTVRGDDDWRDRFEAPAEHLRMFDCTAAVFHRSGLKELGDGTYQAIARSFGEAKDLCASVRFFTQPMAAAASGVLIAPDRVVTAGHVLRQVGLADMAFVFGFHMRGAFDPRIHFAADEVYFATEVLGQGVAPEDWAVLRLDRATRDRPIPALAAAPPRPGQVVHTIGHPMGLPGKFAGGATVLTECVASTFTADLDIFPLCSGSPVFHADDTLAGIVLSEPCPHFVPDGSCYVFAVCQEEAGNTHQCASAFAALAVPAAPEEISLAASRVDAAAALPGPRRDRRFGAPHRGPRDLPSAMSEPDTYHSRAGARLAAAGPADQVAAPFTITIRFLGDLTDSQKAAFRRAADRWSRVIVGDLPSVVIDGERIDDVLILARGEAIDGPGRVLGQAGPTHLRPASAGGLPAKGTMMFDTADLAAMEAQGTLVDVITHELGHVLGVGTLWERKGLLRGLDGPNPVFVGTRARAAYGQLRGTPPRDVPVENEGGAGTRGAHWREVLFTDELMSGYIKRVGNPLSGVTVASLADLGYVVDMAAAEPFELPDLAAMVEAGVLDRAPLVDLHQIVPIFPMELPDRAVE